MSFAINVDRKIGDAHVTFSATLPSSAEAFATARYFATGEIDGAAPSAQDHKPSATEKNVKSAQASATAKETSAKDSTEKQTPDASSSSATSSTESKKDSDGGAKDKQDDAPAALDYEKDIKPLVLAIAKISREKAEGLLQRFGVTSAKNLKADQFAEFKEKADRVISGDYDPTASDEGALV